MNAKEARDIALKVLEINIDKELRVIKSRLKVEASQGKLSVSLYSPVVFKEETLKWLKDNGYSVIYTFNQQYNDTDHTYLIKW